MTRAIRFSDKRKFREQKLAGSFFIDPPNGEPTNFFYFCPCGCGVQSALKIGVKFKPAENPSWEWNGLSFEPSLLPSVNHVGHWHGWLKNGDWVSV